MGFWDLIMAKKRKPRRITLKEAIEGKAEYAELAHQYFDLNPYIPKSKKKKRGTFFG